MGKCGTAALEALPALEKAFAALTCVGGGVLAGEVNGLRYCSIPARDRDRCDPIIIGGEVAVQGLEPYDMRPHLPPAVAFLREQVSAGRRVLIHCLRGENRAGTVAAAFLADAGVDADTAVAQVREVRGRHALSNRAFVEQVHSFAAEQRPRR